MDSFGTLTDDGSLAPPGTWDFSPGALQPGAPVGRYTVREALGEGGMANVYRVEHRLLGTSHALKVLKAQGGRVRDRALREARIQARMRHPNVIAVRDVIEVRGSVGLLLDFAPGVTLAAKLRAGRPPLELALRWFTGVSRGVRAAHQQGVTHRDIKPANVMMVELEGELSPLVTDFGLARVEGGEDIVHAGRAAGSPGYMAPEQIRDAASADARSDLFGLGCVLYELVTGQRAFQGRDARSLMEAILAGDYRPPSELEPGLPPHVCAAVTRCLAPEPEGRFQNVDALLEALEQDALGPEAPDGQVTFVFTDIEGSTRLWERHPGAMRRALRLHDELLRGLARELGGYEVKHEGDALMLAFSDAANAARWCVEAQRRLAEAAWPEELPAKEGAAGLRVRIGLHQGVVEAHIDPVSDRVDYLGAPVNRAARVSAAGHGGQVLCSGDTWGEIAAALPELRAHDLGEHQLLGLDGLVRLIDLQHPELPPRVPPAPRSVGGEQSRPYLGLARYGPEHAPLFFGREVELRRFAERVQAEGLITLTGPSGVGKSSLVGAGLSEALPVADVLRVRPGEAPRVALAAALREHFSPSAAREELLITLNTEPSRLGARLRPLALAAGRPLVLIVDQAEELLTLCRDLDEREAFAEAVASFGVDPASPLRAVLVVREDFFGRLSGVRALAGRCTRAVEVLQPPALDQLERILTEPAALFGYTFEDEGLAREMAAEVAREPAALPLLQACAEQLWERRDRSRRVLTRAAYVQLGGVRGAVAAHAEGALAKLTDAQRALARRLLLRLVSVEGTRLPSSRAALLEASGARVQSEIVLNALIAERLLTVGSAAGGDRIELVHEALVAGWDRLRGWLQEDWEGARMREALGRAAAEWDERGHAGDFLWRGERLEELRVWRRRQGDSLTQLERAFAEVSEREARAQRLRARRLGGVVLAALVLLAVGLAYNLVVANEARVAANHARDEANEAQREATTQALLAKALLEEQAGRPERATPLLRAAGQLIGDERLAPVHSWLLSSYWEGASQLWIGAGAQAFKEAKAGVEVGLEPALSADGERLARILDDKVEVYAVGDLRLLLVLRPSELELASLEAGGSSVVMRPRLAALSEDGQRIATVWTRRPSDEVLQALKLSDVQSVERARRAFVDVLLVTDVATGRLLHEQVVAGSHAGALAFSPDGELLAIGVPEPADGSNVSGSTRLEIGLLNIQSGALSLSPMTCAAPRYSGVHVFWSRDGESLYCAGVELRVEPSGPVTTRLMGSTLDFVSLSVADGRLERRGDVIDALALDGGRLLVLPGDAVEPWASDGVHEVLRLEDGRGRTLSTVQLPPGCHVEVDLPLAHPPLTLGEAGGVLRGSASFCSVDGATGEVLRMSSALDAERLMDASVANAEVAVVKEGPGLSVHLLGASRPVEARAAAGCSIGEIQAFIASGGAREWVALGCPGIGISESGRAVAEVRLHDDRPAHPGRYSLWVHGGPWGGGAVVDELGLSSVAALVVGAAGDTLVLLGNDDRTYLIEWFHLQEGRWERQRHLIDSEERLHDCAFNEDETTLLCVGGGQSWAVLDLTVGDNEPPASRVRTGTFDLAQGGAGRTLGVRLDQESGAFVVEGAGAEAPPSSLSLGEAKVRLLGPPAPSYGVAWVPPAGMWAMHPTGRSETFTWLLEHRPNRGVLFGPSGRRAVTVKGEDLLLHDGRTGELLYTFEGTGSHPEVMFDPDGSGLSIQANGRIARYALPVIAPADVSQALGAATNLRVCRGSLEVVPVAAPLDPESVWAPTSACSAQEAGQDVEGAEAG